MVFTRVYIHNLHLLKWIISLTFHLNLREEVKSCLFCNHSGNNKTLQIKTPEDGASLKTLHDKKKTPRAFLFTSVSTLTGIMLAGLCSVASRLQLKPLNHPPSPRTLLRLLRPLYSHQNYNNLLYSCCSSTCCSEPAGPPICPLPWSLWREEMKALFSEEPASVCRKQR